MKNMALLLDTNIILDWLLQREPFHKNAEKIIAVPNRLGAAIFLLN